MPQESLVVALSTIGPIIGSAIGVWKRPSTVYIHNIPEGICTSAPHFYSYGNRLKSFLMASLSALPIMIGYLVARYLFVQIAPRTMSMLIGATAGLMIYITADELLPAVQSTGRKQTIIFFMAGIIAVILLELVG